MSKPTTNPFLEADFSKLMDVSKMWGEFKVPCYDMEAIMSVYRRNIEAVASVNQAAFETIQALARRQAEVVRQSFEEATGLMNAVMSSPTPEEKVIKQAEASKAAVDKCITSARDFAETVTKCHSKAMETVSTRMNEGLEELRGIIKTTRSTVAA